MWKIRGGRHGEIRGGRRWKIRVGRWWTIRVGRGGGILRWKKREVSRTTMRGKSR